jgi:polysaccharide deacetylase 2 family uncharacterized protein YibQ
VKGATATVSAAQAKAALDRAVTQARREGYELARAHAERATYEGEEAPFAWLGDRDG